MDEGHYGPLLRAAGIPVHFVNLRPNKLPSFRAVFDLIHLAIKQKPNLIVGWMYHGAVAGRILQLMLRWFCWRSSDLVLNIRHSLEDLSNEKKMTSFLIHYCGRIGRGKSVRKIIYNSKASATQHENLGYPSEKTYVIANGFDTSTFAPFIGARDSLLKNLRLKKHHILVGLVARYHPVKDFPCFISAAALVARQRNKARFVLVGRNVTLDNKLLCDLVEEHGLAEISFMLGEKDRIASIYSGLDILVSSSISEAFSNTIGEACSSGTPCVVTDVGDSKYIIGNSGLAVPPRSPGDLADAIIELVDFGSERRERLGRSARDRVISYFSLSKVKTRYEELFLESFPGYKINGKRS